MGKTYKRSPTGIYRRPKGMKRAVLNGARPKAVPPTSWDDIPHCKLAHQHWNLAKNMKDAGVDRETAIRKILKKCRKTRRGQVEDAVDWFWRERKIIVRKWNS